jgi:murein DD-endopeptidase MepM/ murein hydrolase activator NlpD
MKPFVAALLITLALITGFVPPAAAQDGSNTVPPGSTTIHVVQRDETLFRIAMRYGTTVEAISAANGISDPRYIAVGQRLLIPNAQINAPGAVITHMIKPGDTLDTLARAFNTTPASLASANRITNAHLLYAGQEITINQGEADPTVPKRLHRIRPGENLARIALTYRLPLRDLLSANHLTESSPVFVDQRLWIPGDGATYDLPVPFTSFDLTPIPAIQGQTLSIHVTTDGPATLSGDFTGYPVQVVTQDANQHYALFGIHTFANKGVYPMHLTAVGPDGTQTDLTIRISVQEGGYGTEAISLDTQQQDLLTTEVTEPEWERVAMMMSSFTAQRYFDGLMGLPSTGAITSQFGTRRSYNGGQLDTFHSGTDFGGAPGSQILAPAAGVVVLAETLPVRGNATIIDHGWGVCTGYWHQAEIYVKVGDVVAPGQVIGTVGSTGRSTGPHLHWEMWVGGVQVDPMQWVQQSFP